MKAPDFLVIGHITRDLVAGGWRLGGSAAYAALTAARLGRRAAVLTSAPPELEVELRSTLAEVELCIVSSRESTTFENIYGDQGRVQFLRGRAADLSLDDVPQPWRRAPLVLLAPLVGEMAPGLAAALAPSLVGATPQGWMRRWDEGGRVWYRRWEPGPALGYIDALILSEEDLAGDRGMVESYAQRVPTVALTQGGRGVQVCWRGRWRPFPAFSAIERDPTGAGDVFAAAFLIRLAETGDPFEAAPFANCTASFAVEAEGMASLPDREAVEQRLRQGPK